MIVSHASFADTRHMSRKTIKLSQRRYRLNLKSILKRRTEPLFRFN
jgi:hypothetical protein